MREISFRHWNGETIEQVGDLGFFTDGTYLLNEEEVIEYGLMQYTGIKDKNGKEIYEGDIVKGEFSGAYEVVFHNCQFRIGNDGIWKYNIGLEVIGNIYENPELLHN